MATARGLTRGAGPAIDVFKSAGYEFIYLESPWGVSACGPSVDVCYPYWTITETAKWLGEFTIFANLIEAGTWTVSPDSALRQFATLRDLAASPASSPRLVYAHVGVPHGPFVLNAECERWDNPMSANWEVTPDSSDPYLEQLRCANRQIRDLIEVIDQTSPESVVVITADHGVSLQGQWRNPLSEWSPEEIEESSSIFTAYRLPATCPNTYVDDFQLVNTFRLVIDCLFDQSLGLLPPRNFHAFTQDTASIEVTEVTPPVD